MVMDEKKEYYKLPFYKRLTSVMVDFMLTFTMFVLLVLLFATFVPNLMNKDEELKSYYSEMTTFLYNTDLYGINNEGVVAIYEDDNIYNAFEFSNHLDVYLENKEKSGLFTLIDNSYIEKGSKEELDAFYKDNWELAKRYIENMDGYRVYNELYQDKVQDYLGLSIAVPLLVSVLIIFIVIPFINPDGKTIGKKLFHISVVTDDLKPTNRLQIFSRQFFFVLFTMTVIPSIVSLVMYMFKANGKTLHDSISLSRVIDSNVKKVLLNPIKKEKDEIKEDEFNFKGDKNEKIC